MADSTTPIQQITAGANADVRVNENFDLVSPQAVYGRRASTTTGLTWGVQGGRWSSIATSNTTLTLTASLTNYISVNRSTAIASVSTSITNWNDAINYARCYLIIVGASTVTSYEDHRAGLGGVHGQLSTTITGAVLGAINVYTKNQSVTPVTLTSGASIVVDASLSNNFKLVLATTGVLANPTNPTDGMVLNIRIKQDATGSRLLTYGTAYKWPGGTVPTLSTTANAVDVLSMYYDSTDAAWACVINKAFA